MNIEEQKELYKTGDWICVFKGILGDGWKLSPDGPDSSGNWEQKLIHKKHKHILDTFLDGCEIYGWCYNDFECGQFERPFDFIKTYSENYNYLAVPKSLENCYCEATESHFDRLSSTGYSSLEWSSPKHVRKDIPMWLNINPMLFSLSSKADKKHKIIWSKQINNWVYCSKEYEDGTSCRNVSSMGSMGSGDELVHTDTNKGNFLEKALKGTGAYKYKIPKADPINEQSLSDEWVSVDHIIANALSPQENLKEFEKMQKQNKGYQPSLDGMKEAFEEASAILKDIEEENGTTSEITQEDIERLMSGSEITQESVNSYMSAGNDEETGNGMVYGSDKPINNTSINNNTSKPINNFEEHNFTADFEGEILAMHDYLVGTITYQGKTHSAMWTSKGEIYNLKHFVGTYTKVLKGDFNLTPIVPEYPVFKKNSNGEVYRFDEVNPNGISVLWENRYKATTELYGSEVSSWTDVEYDTERRLYHGQPIFCYGKDNMRRIDYYDVKLKRPMVSMVNRNIEPISLEALKTLPFIWEQYTELIKG